MAMNDLTETKVGNFSENSPNTDTTPKTMQHQGDSMSQSSSGTNVSKTDTPNNINDFEADLETRLPDFRMARPSNPSVGHNQPPSMDSATELADIRRILVGPVREETEQRLETLISILEEREAEMVAREKKMNALLTEINQRSIAMIRRIQKEQRMAIDEMEQRTLATVEEMRTEYNDTISSVGSALATLGEQISGLPAKSSKPFKQIHN